MKQLKLGIPNRSSLLHVGAVGQCLKAGIISREIYHPAKLYYETSDFILFLVRSNDLCGMMNEGKLDIIFTGDDYALENLTIETEKFVYPMVEVKFALLSSDE